MHGSITRDTSVVDHNINGPQILGHQHHALLARLEITHVPFVRSNAGLGGEGLGRVVITAIIGRYLVPDIFQRHADGFADTARSAGDNCNS